MPDQDRDAQNQDSWIDDIFGGLGSIFGQVANTAGQFLGATEQTKQKKYQAQIEAAKAQQSGSGTPSPAPNRAGSASSGTQPDYAKWGIYIGLGSLALAGVGLIMKMAKK